MKFLHHRRSCLQRLAAYHKNLIHHWQSCLRRQCAVVGPVVYLRWQCAVVGPAAYQRIYIPGIHFYGGNVQWLVLKHHKNFTSLAVIFAKAMCHGWSGGVS
jgi:hypothetical protein